MDGVTLFIMLMVSPFLAMTLVKLMLYLDKLWKERKKSNEDVLNEVTPLKHKYFKGVPRKSVSGARDQSQADADFYEAFIWWCKINNASSTLFEGWVEVALIRDIGYSSIKYEWYVYRRLIESYNYSTLIYKALGEDVKLIYNLEADEGIHFYKIIPLFLAKMEKNVRDINFHFGDNLEYIEKYSENINYGALTTPFVVDTMSLHKLDTPLN